MEIRLGRYIRLDDIKYNTILNRLTNHANIIRQIKLVLNNIH